MSKPIHILIVEDTAADAELAARALRKAIQECEIQVVETRQDFLNALETFQPEVILSDYSLPHFDGMQALKLAQEHAPLTPLIIWTGSISEDVAVACIKAGANDYVLKDNFKRLGPAVAHALEEREALVARRQAEANLREERKLLRTLIDNLPDLIYVMDREGRKTISNTADWHAAGGRGMEDVLGKTDAELYPPGLAEQFMNLNRTVIESGQPVINHEETGLDANGNLVSMLTTKVPLRDSEGNVIGLVGIGHDITQRKQAEARINDLLAFNEKILNHSPLGILTYKITGECVYANENAAVIVGAPVKVLQAQNFHTIEAWRQSGFYDLVQKAITSQAPVTDDLHHVSTFGKDIWLTVHCTTFKSKGEDHVLVSFADITQRKQAEADRLESAIRFRTLFEASPDAILLLDPADGWRILDCNPSTCQMNGYSREELIGQSIDILNTSPGIPLEQAEYLAKVQQQGILRYETIHRRKDGTLITVEVSTSLIRVGEREIVLGIDREITERKRSEMEIHRQMSELEALYENGLAVSRLLTPREIGNQVIETFARYLSWHHVAIRLRREGSDSLDLVAFNLPDLEKWDEAERLFNARVNKVGQGLSGWVIQTGFPLRTGNVYAHPQYIGSHVEIQSGLYMPLKVGGRVIGVISVESEKQDAFTEQDERLLATLANQAAVAFENARLYEVMQKELAERKRVEEALRSSETHYRELADSITDILFELDQDLRYTHWNKASEEFSGIPAEKAIGKSIQEIWGVSEDQARREGIYRSVLSDRQPRTFEIEALIKGRKRALEISAYPSMRGVSVVAKDVTERKQMEVALETERNQLARRVEERTADLSRANLNLARALRVKDEFLANMSHELRTPLNAILGLSESLAEQIAGPLNEKQQKYINTISESGHHLLALINDILDLAKIEAGQITLDINKVDIRSVCQSSLRMVRQLAQKKNQEISLEIDEGLVLMWADERRLKQMIVNLLGNAVKFTPENGRLGLEVHGDEASNQITFTVWDDGIGIKREDLERLFQPFVQLDSGLAREATGTGLGLALVAQMAHLHGGSVSAESKPEKGSRFSITLPWQPALKADTVSRLRNTGRLHPMRSSTPKKPVILLVEDMQDVTMMIRDYLERAGYEVVTASNGVEALTQARHVHPNLILMDVMMPDMDGVETTQKLRSEPDFRYTPIVALTALAMPSDRERCLAAGMDEYISKPVNLRSLVRIIEGLLFSHEETKP
ncbi:MAG TPA: PAS domain S-box protein [Anaerolineales bacterium]|nr:PAS domain S-box protein [Anaerolineales bacterium]